MLNSKPQTGLTLIEVLVSVLVLSIGVLGATGLQLLALDSNRDALFRSEAAQFGNDLIDRVDVNTGVTYGPISLGDAPPTATNCETNVCTPAQIATYDITSWLCSINSLDSDGNSYASCDSLGITGSLPDGSGSIARTGDEYQIVVQWQDIKSNQASSVTFYSQVR